MKPETIQDFYFRHSLPEKAGVFADTKTKSHFNVYRREDFCGRNATPYNRRDFYKISLIIGTGVLYYADKGIEINSPALLFSNPVIPYSWEPRSASQKGYFCLFTEDFVNENTRLLSISESTLFKIGGNPVFFPEDRQVDSICEIFGKMMAENESEYIYKLDLIRNYVHLLIHEALKLQPADNYFRHANASSRIAGLFIELLERQFPIDTPGHVLNFKTAADYAAKLSVHVNHLNRAVKEVTGKTTTEHIAERIVHEAKALLKHTDWNVAEVAYSLGFENPAYFNNFFKKQTSLTPKSFR
ncbi:Helix-turn-helix domain-containing protein [Pseudarcicella hirudinis]|uniref:Helix-turn-helix domain-containing protein n=1 Tax=Pseudarcicella hirudinis TaxID=1079859 RepID=A0A1I5SJM8_9BACT|nr:helix-turn-helix domain-containing protein [Pseudarcicella hirudinis]SFP70566.1 Helix-turn-helix domain-containing protein [Pseudarcicella hirudinis]